MNQKGAQKWDTKSRSARPRTRNITVLCCRTTEVLQPIYQTVSPRTLVNKPIALPFYLLWWPRHRSIKSAKKTPRTAATTTPPLLDFEPVDVRSLFTPRESSGPLYSA